MNGHNTLNGPYFSVPQAIIACRVSLTIRCGLDSALQK
jgi:hypothetical protein